MSTLVDRRTLADGALPTMKATTRLRQRLRTKCPRQESNLRTQFRKPLLLARPSLRRRAEPRKKLRK